MKRQTTLFWVIFLCLVSMAMADGVWGFKMTEICDNARDDDGDGLIDLQDPDCECPVIEPISRIPNPSFEERTCCPSNRSELHCAETWIQASDPTTDYLHTCGWMGWEQFPPPRPFPDGNAVVGFRDGRFFQDSADPNWKEYAGACLLAPLEAGVPYRFEFEVGFTGDGSSPSINITFFGNADCANLPFGQGNQELGCPTNDTTNWLKLGSVWLSGSNNWVKGSIDVTPDVDIHTIAIGPDCVERNRTFSTYYFFDNLILDEEEAFELRIKPINHPCAEDFRIGVPQRSGVEYQWYKDGVALPGEKDATLSVKTGEGNYQVRILGEKECRITRIYTHRVPKFETVLEEKVCEGNTYRFGTQDLDASGFYENRFITPDNCDSLVELTLEVVEHSTASLDVKIFEGTTYRIEEYEFRESGPYEVLLGAASGCDSIVQLNLQFYDVAIPNVFSPDGNGLNDFFNVYGDSSLEEIMELRVFSRWGELVYEGRGLTPNALSEGWDGMVQGRPAPTGTYIYSTTLLSNSGQQQHFAGAVTLLR